jgi:hypothetical protein
MKARWWPAMIAIWISLVIALIIYLGQASQDATTKQLQHATKAECDRDNEFRALAQKDFEALAGGRRIIPIPQANCKN